MRYNHKSVAYVDVYKVTDFLTWTAPNISIVVVVIASVKQLSKTLAWRE